MDKNTAFNAIADAVDVKLNQVEKFVCLVYVNDPEEPDTEILRVSTNLNYEDIPKQLIDAALFLIKPDEKELLFHASAE